MKEYYEIEINGLKRKLPLCPLTDKLYIGAFVIFGDVELTKASAEGLLKLVPREDYDYMLTAESKGIPLIYEDLFVDWKTSMPYANLDKPWWYQNVLRDLNFGDKVYGEVIELTYETSTWKTGLEEVFKEGWDIIITGTYDMKEYIIPLIGEYPDQKIWFYDEEWNYDDANGWQYCPAPNLYAMLFAQNEGSFVVGAMAAMLSQAKKVAFMGGMDNTVLDDFFVGFANGAKYIDPEVKVNLSWMNSFNDASAGKDVSTGLYADGFDVVFACGGQAGLGGFDSVITQAEGNWIIGVDGDQGAYFASLGSDEGNKKAARTITSMKKNVNQGFYDAMKQHLAGTLPYGKNVKLGLNGGYVSYAITDTTKKVFSAEQLAQISVRMLIGSRLSLRKLLSNLTYQ